MSEAYVNPLTERYASAEMSALFSPRFKFETWRRLWLWLAEEERRLGLPVPEEALAQMAAQLPLLLEAGASMIGGCCGTTPAHIAAFRPVIDKWNRRRD